jgi:GNAT superfamily N-acetyltransferase
VIVRRGGTADVDTVLGLMDEAVRWLVSQGRPGQWGTEPFSGNPKRVEQIREWAPELWLAESEGEVVGALALGVAKPPVPPSDVPEVFVRGLVGSRKGRGAGRVLLDHARAEAERRGVDRLRVDCYAGDDGALVAFYVLAGFTPTDTFAVGEWPGQVLEIALR